MTSARVFALNGVSEPQRIAAFAYGFEYDSARQMHVVRTEAGSEPAVDLATGIHINAQAMADTWCRDPSNYNYKIKDDTL